jgi:hypothetical protein
VARLCYISGVGRRLFILGLLTLGALASIASNGLTLPDAGLPACPDLVRRACGELGECEGSRWCEAAKMLQDQDEDGGRCQRALDQDEQYPLCEPEAGTIIPDRQLPSGCEALLDHVCGEADTQGARPCGDSDACANASLLTIASTTPEAGLPSEDSGPGADAGDTAATLAAKCDAALQENALFPRCAP